MKQQKRNTLCETDFVKRYMARLEQVGLSFDTQADAALSVKAVKALANLKFVTAVHVTAIIHKPMNGLNCLRLLLLVLDQAVNCAAKLLT